MFKRQTICVIVSLLSCCVKLVVFFGLWKAAADTSWSSITQEEDDEMNGVSESK